jgi:hypothetical protein
MKFVALLLVITIALNLGCGSPSPIVGKWKPSQRYDRFQETWEPAKDDVFVEFSSDGKFSGFLNGKRTGGTYTVDTTGTPHHLILNDGNSGTTNVVFKIEGNTLTWKSYLDTAAIFPPNLEPLNNEPNFELVKFERQQ